MHLNVQADLRSRLAAALEPVEVRTSVPDPRPDELVTVRREGGARQNALLDRPGVGILCWAPTEERACELAHDVADVVDSLGFGDGYALVEMDSMESDPDPDSQTPRWYLSYTITCFKPTTQRNKEAWNG